MTSMDKRKGSLTGRPKRQYAMYVVLKKPMIGGDTTVEKIFTNLGKADTYVTAQIGLGDGHRYWSERWQVD